MGTLSHCLWLFVKVHFFLGALIGLLFVLGGCGYQPLGTVEGFEFDLVHLAFESGARP